MPEWQSIDLPDSQAVQLANSRDRRLEVYWAEFDTTIPQERADLMSFIMHPLRSLTGREPEDAYAASNLPPSAASDVIQRRVVPGLAIDGVDETWRVVTTIHNHHRGLNPRITRFMATVSGGEETVYLVADKEYE